MQKQTAPIHPAHAHDPFPDKSQAPIRVRRLACADPKIEHGAARIFCLLIEWSYQRDKGRDGHGSVVASTRAIAQAIGACRDFVRVWIADLVRRKYLEVDLVKCGRGPGVSRFRIVGMYEPELGLEVGPIEQKRIGPSSRSTIGPSSRSTIGPSSRPNSLAPIITVKNREIGEVQKGSLSGTERISKTAETDKLLKGSAAFRLKRCEAPGKNRKGKPAIDSEAEAEFLELIERNAGRGQVEQWGGWWRNEFRKNPDRWSRIWLEIDAMRREGNPPKRPAHYAKKMFKIFA